MKLDSKKQEELNEVLEGLKRPYKSISSKFFYDSKGCELFQKITQLDEYYLSRCEREILSNIGPALQKHVGSYNIEFIEIGPGDGSKGRLVLSQLLTKETNIKYFGIDICDQALTELKREFSQLPQKVDPQLVLGDYLKFSNLPLAKNKKRKIVCFFGSSIGNLSHEESTQFIKEVSHALTDGDYFLIGFDLKKDLEVMTKAYNDSLGITREFNLNLLTRFNREFNADFDKTQFDHLEYYSEQIGAMVSFLVSKTDQIEDVMEERFSPHGDWIKPPMAADRFIESVQTLQIIQDCIDRLPTTQRAAFCFREVEDLEMPEICKILDVSNTNLGVLLFRAKNRLRECVERKVDGK